MRFTDPRSPQGCFLIHWRLPLVPHVELTWPLSPHPDCAVGHQCHTCHGDLCLWQWPPSYKLCMLPLSCWLWIVDSRSETWQDLGLGQLDRDFVFFERVGRWEEGSTGSDMRRLCSMWDTKSRRYTMSSMVRISWILNLLMSGEYNQRCGHTDLGLFCDRRKAVSRLATLEPLGIGF